MNEEIFISDQNERVASAVLPSTDVAKSSINEIKTKYGYFSYEFTLKIIIVLLLSISLGILLGVVLITDYVDLDKIVKFFLNIKKL